MIDLCVLLCSGESGVVYSGYIKYEKDLVAVKTCKGKIVIRRSTVKEARKFFCSSTITK